MSLITNLTNMYIPHEIGDKVYFYNPYGINRELNSGIIKSVTVKEDGTIYKIDSETINHTFGIDLKEHQFYPSKSVAKEELLRRAVNYANEVLIDN